MATGLPSLRDSKVNARSEVEIGSRSERAERKGGVKGDSSGWKPKIGVRRFQNTDLRIQLGRGRGVMASINSRDAQVVKSTKS